jgi:hypothetical protein
MVERVSINSKFAGVPRGMKIAFKSGDSGGHEALPYGLPRRRPVGAGCVLTKDRTPNWALTKDRAPD